MKTMLEDVQCAENFSLTENLLYENGKAWTGKQRFLCLICGMQFTNSSNRAQVKGKPVCPRCGKSMNLYKIEGDVIRFRCPGYPECKTFK